MGGMPEIIVVGGGPAGLSAALFTAKNGLETTVYDTGETWMHKAHLFNYLGVGSIDGSAFMQTAHQQVRDYGVEVVETAVEDVGVTDGGITVETADGQHDRRLRRARDRRRPQHGRGARLCDDR
jgi:Thioredoxin reductase